MAEENDANVANYSENEVHLRFVKSRIKNGNDEVQKNLMEDLEAYYEQAVNLRRMRIETLETTLEETKACYEGKEKRLTKIVHSMSIFVCCIFLGAALFCVERITPGFIFDLIDMLPWPAIATHGGVAVAVFVGVYLMKLNHRHTLTAAKST